MCKCVKLSKNNIERFSILNKNRLNFNYLNSDYFQEYNNSGFLKKIFLRNEVAILQKNKEFCGYIWASIKNQNNYTINSLSVDLCRESESFLYYILSSLKKGYTFSYMCENNGFNIELLQKVGFYKSGGTVEMLLNVSYNSYFNISKDIQFEVFKRGKEDIRCYIQNEVFKHASRIPITVKDILLDKSQEYYFSPGAIFVKKNDKYIGYGQIIIEDEIPIIVNVGILNEYRHKGYGKALINYLLNIIKNYNFKNVLINVDYDNDIALNLYRNCGFKKISENFTLKIKT
ncbi:GNAT family N-acetyltransferase [Clostridium rectalis]|uniref:GNAT family N-acetyltransferase n=1 Tax=Clostridium rectalis TaxID=2040295 RepID=UPI0013DDF99B|nr:GNAT family N-acetyltransferase [Clostridium rectalis]